MSDSQGSKLKKCSRCDESKPLSDFHKNKAQPDGRHNYCIPCRREHRLERSEETNARRRELYAMDPEYYKARVKEYNSRPEVKIRKAKWSRATKYRNKIAWFNILVRKFSRLACSKCGYDKFFEVLDGHHIDPTKKEFTLSYIICRRPLSKYIEELDKIVLLCRNCHGEKHLEMGNGKKNRYSSTGVPLLDRLLP